MKFDEDYFLHGKKLGLSLYEDYRWLPDLTIPMAHAIIKHLGIGYGDTILDFGCARGYLVKALHNLGYFSFGVDVSEWAIRNCDPEVAEFIQCNDRITTGRDWIIAKDVLEHIEDLENIKHNLMGNARKGIFIVVPLSSNHIEYDIKEYELDKTHIHRLPLSSWIDMFLYAGWSVEARYRIKGIKDNYADTIYGNGFITCRRL
jgi:predicted TPR repeat methyltransferase